MNVKRVKRGMTLIELLVTMVILVIGIFTIARVFPLGFRSINHARQITQASRLAQAELERWKLATANIPDGILAETPGSAVINTDFNPEDLGTVSLPNGFPEDTWFWSNVNRTRLIKGESTTIPAPTVLPYGTGGNLAFSIYNLKFAPVEFYAQGEGNNVLPKGFEWPDQYVLIYADPAPRVDVTGANDDDLDSAIASMDGQSYAIDYDSGTVYFRASHWPRTFKAEYAWWDGSTLRTEIEVLRLDGNNNDPVKVQLAHGNLDSYSDRIARKFEYRQPGNFSRYNAFEFTLLNDFNGMSFSPTIGFNPIGQRRTVRTNLGNRPLTAHIDYEVLDWHILREDRTVPAPPTPDPKGYAIRLTLPNIKMAGVTLMDGLNAVYAPNDVKPTRVKYQGLTSTMNGISLVALDLTDNTLMVDKNVAHPLQVDYRAGIVRFPSTITKFTPFGGELTVSANDLRGHDVRLFYQATGDWAVQVGKAYSSYQRLLSNDPANLQYNQFVAETLSPGQRAATGLANDSDRVALAVTFPRSDAGKAVSVSFQWYDKNGSVRDVAARQYKLPTFGTVGSGLPSVLIPFADVADFEFPAQEENWKNPYFTFVQGATLEVRTIWREGPRRWNSRTLETSLSRR